VELRTNLGKSYDSLQVWS